MIHYVLDGYNVIQSGPDELLVKGTLQRKRDFLLELLKGLLARAAGTNKITVVFDGPESAPFLSSGISSSCCSGISVVFSEGKTADERIEELVLTNAKPSEITVVTNDKGIRRLLGASGAKFMGVDDFAKKLFPDKGAVYTAPDVRLDAGEAEKIDKELKDMWLKPK